MLACFETAMHGPVLLHLFCYLSAVGFWWLDHNRNPQIVAMHRAYCSWKYLSIMFLSVVNFTCIRRTKIAIKALLVKRIASDVHILVTCDGSWTCDFLIVRCHPCLCKQCIATKVSYIHKTSPKGRISFLATSWVELPELHSCEGDVGALMQILYGLKK